MLEPILNNLAIPGSILILEFIVINYCIFEIATLSLIIFFLIQHMPKNIAKTIHEVPKFSRLQWDTLPSAPCFFTNHLKLVNSIPELSQKL